MFVGLLLFVWTGIRLGYLTGACARVGPPIGTPHVRTPSPHGGWLVPGLFYDPAVPDAFWAKLDWSAKADGCWSWGQRHPSQYQGVPMFKGKGAARFLYQAQVRPLARTDVMVPGCGNSVCVNPDHQLVRPGGERHARHLAWADRNRTALNDLHELDPADPVVVPVVDVN